MSVCTINSQKDGRQVAARRLDAVVVPPISSSASSRRQARPCVQPLPPAHGCGPLPRRARPSRRAGRSRPGISGRRSLYRADSVELPAFIRMLWRRQTACLQLAFVHLLQFLVAGGLCMSTAKAMRGVRVLPHLDQLVVRCRGRLFFSAHFSFSDGAYLHLSTHIVPQAACAVNYYFSRPVAQHRQDRHNPQISRDGGKEES